ncbi:hypothetical protein [Kutzneria sp. 744]|uniref:hypothetical protein n=1 Tax=Kutzneria sp. (strain 744) TaxID=345341 RepID=UPI0005BDC345|nr:hypothetical protein [Kutzneria sp. 744]
MALPIIGLAKAVTVAAIDTTIALVSLPARVIGLVGAAESMVERITEVVERPSAWSWRSRPLPPRPAWWW